ncbi:MAG: MerR family transcriptional regulator [Lachnospiraceae bacterium]|nr:MerR family transcriptional regulator [Lachnospiraceae bacterium]
MKIGRFAAVCNVSTDTIRYYIQENLLFPRKNGTQWEFTNKDLDDFSRIQELKQMRFSIRETQAALQLERMSNLIEAATIDEYETILHEKKRILEKEQEELTASMTLLDKELGRTEQMRRIHKKGHGGVPLSSVSLLTCPECRKQLNIVDASISFSYITEGTLSCSCGYQARIRDGIVCTGHLYEGHHDTPDLKRELYHDTGREWEICMQKGTERMLEEIRQTDLHRKVVFEANINGFFFTYHFLKQLPHDNLFIFVDKYEEVLRMYKNYMEILYSDLNVLYIADASEHYPLKDNCIDVQLGIMGENEYAFYHRHHQIFDLSSQLKQSCEIIGLYSSCPKTSATMQQMKKRYPEGSERQYHISNLEEDYRACGYQMELTHIGDVLHTIKHHSYCAHVDGEPLSVYVYHAKKIQ